MKLNNKKLVALGLVTVMSLSVLTACSSSNNKNNNNDKNDKETVATSTPEAEETTLTLKDGTYTKTAEEADSNGFTYEMTMTVKDGKITALSYDGKNADGKSKSQMSLDGEYVMTEDGLTWDAQSKALADYVIAQQSLNGIKTDDNGKTDAITGVSIAVTGFVDFANALLKEASNS